MLNILLILHIVISILLIIVILLQRTGADSISGISGGNSNVSHSSTGNPLVKITTVLAAAFMINALLLNNLSTKQHKAPVKIFEENLKQPKIPIAK